MMRNFKRITVLTVMILTLVLCYNIRYAVAIPKSVTYKTEFQPLGSSQRWSHSIPTGPGAPISLHFEFLLSGGTLTAELNGSMSFDQKAETLMVHGNSGRMHSDGGVKLTGDLTINTIIPLSIFKEGASIPINHTQAIPGFPNIDKSWDKSETLNSLLLSGTHPESVTMEAGIPKLITQQISAVELSAIIGRTIVSGGTLTVAAKKFVDSLTEYIDGGIAVNGGLTSSLKLSGEMVTANGESIVREGQTVPAAGFDPSQDAYHVYSEYVENFTHTLDFAVSADIYANLNVLLIDIFSYEKEIAETRIPILPERTFDLAFTTHPSPIIFPLDGEDEEDTADENANPGDSTQDVYLPDPSLRSFFNSCLNSINSGRAPADRMPMSEYMERYTEFSRSGVSDITGLEALVNVARLYLGGNDISDISPLAGLTKLESLELHRNNIADISPLAGLNALENLNLADNDISDISPLVELSGLKELSLVGNNITDVSPLLGSNTPERLNIHNNLLDYSCIYEHIPALETDGTIVGFDNRVPATLSKMSGDAQSEPRKTRLAPFVVEVKDQNGLPFAGVPVTFAVTIGAGTLSAEITTTDRDGRSQSTLTLGKTDATVTVSTQMIDTPATFTATVTTEDHTPNPTLPEAIANVHIPDPGLRAELNRKLVEYNSGLEIPATMEAYLAGVTNLDLSELDIHELTGLEKATKLEYLSLASNRISDISVLKDLTALRSLVLSKNNVSNISALSGLTSLLNLWLDNNGVSDISVLSNLTSLNGLYLGRNTISDISPLKALRTTLRHLDLTYLPLDYTSIHLYIPMLQARGVRVFFSLRVPTTLSKISGDKQSGAAGDLLKPFVVEVTDTDGLPFAGVPITFVVTVGDGTLSTEVTVTDTTGRAESILTLQNTNTTVTVDSEILQKPINFTARVKSLADLALYFSFDEGAGTTVTDLSIHQNYGRIYKANWVQGKYGNAIELSGERGGGVEVPDAPSLDITDEITLMAWVRPTQFTSEWLRIIVKTWAGDTAPWMAYGLYQQGGSNGKTGFIVSVDGGREARCGNGPSPQLPLNQWTHLAATYDGTRMKLYYDGELKVEVKATGKIDTNDVPLSIGRNNEGNREHYVGLIDEVAIWNVALDASEIRQAMDAGVSGFNATLGTTSPLSGIPNRPPVAAQVIPAQTLIVDGTPKMLDISSYFFDPDGDNLNYTVTSDNTGVATVATSGTEMTITPEAIGRTTIRVRVSDGTLSLTQRISIQVSSPLEVNPVAGTVRPEDLAVYFSFNEGTGATATDLSVHQNHGRLHKANWTHGKYGNGIELSGERGGWVEVHDSSSLDITDEITLMAWVCPTQFTQEWLRIIVKTWAEDTTPWMVYGLYQQGDSNGKTGFIVSVDGGQEARCGNGPSPQLPLNQWTHLAATYDGTRMKLYYDGELEVEVEATGKIDTNDIPLSIGRNNEGDREHYIGLIDEVAIWNIALDASEIRQAMGGDLIETPGTTAVASFNFDDPFEGNALQNPNWQWQNEPVNWDVGETRENFLHIEGETNRNLWTADTTHFLYQETDADMFDVETHFFTRWDTSSGVNGLVVKSPADNDWVTLKFWARDPGPKGHIQYQARGRGLVGDPRWRPEPGTTELFFRLRKDGNTYTGWYKSREADTWIEIGAADMTLTPPLQLGIYVGVAADTGTLEVDYDYFRNTVNTAVQVAPTLNASTTIIPIETALFPNYPNPFNPETWLPYQLSGPADVTLTIYSIRGVIIRRLALGHRPAGVYHSRSRAAYWDGRNQTGEPVASGLYFYTLTAGDFSATRKMLIRK